VLALSWVPDGFGMAAPAGKSRFLKIPRRFLPPKPAGRCRIGFLRCRNATPTPQHL